MNSLGVEQSEESYLFPSPSVLRELEQGEYKGPIVKQEAGSDSDRIKNKGLVNMVASSSWVDEQLQSVFKYCIPSSDDEVGEKRCLGTHTGRKTHVLLSILMGQISQGLDGKPIWGELKKDALCKTVGMSLETLLQYYIQDSETVIENIREEQEEFKEFLDYFRPGMITKTMKSKESNQQNYHFCESRKNKNSKCIIQYINKRFETFGQIKTAADYYTVMKSAQNIEEHVLAAEMVYEDLRNWFTMNPSFHASNSFINELKSNYKKLVRFSSNNRT